MRRLLIASEQHSHDYTWRIEHLAERRWDAIVANRHEATFVRRQDARVYLRLRKAVVRRSAVG